MPQCKNSLNISVFQWIEPFIRTFSSKKGRIVFRILIFAIGSFILFIAGDILFPLPSFQQNSQAVFAADSTLMNLSLSPDEKWRLRSRPGDITEDISRVILFREDRWFRYHPGVNPIAIGRAALQNLKSGGRVSGASTITMQVARLLERRPRNYMSKMIEIFRALQLEWHYSKQQILGLWIDHVSYGGNIEGIRAASLFYYGCEPGVLSWAQLATLLVIPNNPNALNPNRYKNRLLEERNHWLKKMAEGGLLNSQELSNALIEPVTMQRRPAPSFMPQLARQLKRENPHKEEIYTLIRPGVQKLASDIVTDASTLLKYKGISNMAVMIMNNATGAVEAYVASADFYDNFSSGQVDGLKAIRSPGSTLKPFLYTMAFDQGTITPLMTINDVPANFMGYAPENYDQRFNGRVTISEALARSLNMPAVKILELTGVDRFNRFMASAGFKTIDRDRDKMGLSMILGGCGVTAIELTRAYSAFARGGISIKPRFRMTDPILTDTLFSEAAAWMTTRILSLPTRPDLPLMFENSTNLPPVSWKTGTSYGRRDGWAVGFNSHYTITVWAGNFDGHGAAFLSGADVATPVLFRLFQAVDQHPVRNWLKQPKEVKFRQVCNETGLLPGDSCHHLVTDAFIPGHAPTIHCEHLKAIWTNKAGSISYCSDCMPSKGVIRRWYPNYPPELIAWFTDNNIPFKAIPPHNPVCERVMKAGAPQIVSPVDMAEYLISTADSTPLMLNCHSEGDVTTIYWYINHRLLKKTRRSEPVFFIPQEGVLRIGCVDDKGRSSSINITVRYY